MNERRYGKARFRRFASRKEMGAAAAVDIASAVREAVAAKGSACVVFASAPSQDDVLAALRGEKGVDWSRVTAFHMDEYIGLPQGDPRSFSGYLDRMFFDHFAFAEVHRIDGMAPPEEECRRYAGLLATQPVDVVLMGIGENGHIAFNDPPVADFNDPFSVKKVELEAACRRQQVNDGCFPDFDSVPKFAITLTIPSLTGAARQFCIVPGERKAAALRDALTGPVSARCPASILREAGNVSIYADSAAAGLL